MIVEVVVRVFVQAKRPALGLGAVVKALNLAGINMIEPTVLKEAKDEGRNKPASISH